HEADIGLKAWAPSREALFEAMAEALTAVVTSSARVAPLESVQIRCSAPDDEMLLVDWLNALIYQMATRGLLFGAWTVRLQGRELEAEVWGEPVERARHAPAVEPKGVTFTALKVERLPE